MKEGNSGYKCDLMRTEVENKRIDNLERVVVMQL